MEHARFPPERGREQTGGRHTDDGKDAAVTDIGGNAAGSGRCAGRPPSRAWSTAPHCALRDQPVAHRDPLGPERVTSSLDHPRLPYEQGAGHVLTERSLLFLDDQVVGGLARPECALRSRPAEQWDRLAVSHGDPVSM